MPALQLELLAAGQLRSVVGKASSEQGLSEHVEHEPMPSLLPSHFSWTPRNSFMPRIRWASSSDAAPVTLRSVQLVAFSASLPLSSLFFLACEDSREGVAGQSCNLPPHVAHHPRTASATAVALSCQACSWPPSRSALRRAQSCTNSTATDSAHTPSRAAAISARDGLGTATWGAE